MRQVAQPWLHHTQQQHHARTRAAHFQTISKHLLCTPPVHHTHLAVLCRGGEWQAQLQGQQGGQGCQVGERGGGGVWRDDASASPQNMT